MLLKMQPDVFSIPATTHNETSPVRTWEYEKQILVTLNISQP